MVFVHADDARACSGLRLIEASTEPPTGPERFHRVDLDGVAVFVLPAAGRLPGALDLELRGRRAHLEAYWDGASTLL